MVVLLVGLVLIGIAFAFRLRAIPEPPPPPPRRAQQSAMSRERRLLEIFYRLPRADKVTIVLMLVGALVGTTFGLYALVLAFW